MENNKFNQIIKFDSKLKSWKYKIQKIAEEEKLTYFPVVFEMISPDDLYQIAARTGFMERYSHWEFGQSYDHMYKEYFYGLSKISEMVVNTDPVYAYLMTNNSLVDQKLVMAHVYGHADFFKNNIWFSNTDRKMINKFSDHARVISEYIDKYGTKEIENFIDICSSLDQHIDRHEILMSKSSVEDDKEDKNIDLEAQNIDRFKISPEKFYMDKFVNPDEEIIKLKKEKKKELEEEEKKSLKKPYKDLFLFLMEHAPLKNWQRNILSMIRDESYYFVPQSMTKIMNEGWASYWHDHILTKRGILDDSEVIDYAEHHAATMGSSRSLNPYKLGLEIWNDIEDRWNKGRFGKDWEECDDYKIKKSWDKKLNLGHEKIFEVRKYYNDVEFIDEFFTRELCTELKLFTIDKAKEVPQGTKAIYEISSKEFKDVKQKLLFMLTNHGRPSIEVVDKNYEKNGTLLLKHNTNKKINLNIDETKEVVDNIYNIWQNTVRLESTNSEKTTTFLNTNGNTVLI